MSTAQVVLDPLTTAPVAVEVLTLGRSKTELVLLVATATIFTTAGAIPVTPPARLALILQENACSAPILPNTLTKASTSHVKSVQSLVDGILTQVIQQIHTVLDAILDAKHAKEILSIV